MGKRAISSGGRWERRVRTRMQKEIFSSTSSHSLKIDAWEAFI